MKEQSEKLNQGLKEEFHNNGEKLQELIQEKMVCRYLGYILPILIRR